jgi:hypothetical protein
MIDVLLMMLSSVGAKNPIGLPIVEFAFLRLLASGYGQPYIKCCSGSFSPAFEAKL